MAIISRFLGGEIKFLYHLSFETDNRCLLEILDGVSA